MYDPSVRHLDGGYGNGDVIYGCDRATGHRWVLAGDDTSNGLVDNYQCAEFGGPRRVSGAFMAILVPGVPARRRRSQSSSVNTSARRSTPRPTGGPACPRPAKSVEVGVDRLARWLRPTRPRSSQCGGSGRMRLKVNWWLAPSRGPVPPRTAARRRSGRLGRSHRTRRRRRGLDETAPFAGKRDRVGPASASTCALIGSRSGLSAPRPDRRRWAGIPLGRGWP